MSSLYFKCYKINFMVRENVCPRSAMDPGDGPMARRVKMRIRGARRVKMRSRQGHVRPAGLKCGVGRAIWGPQGQNTELAGPFEAFRVKMWSQQGHLSPAGWKWGASRVVNWWGPQQGGKDKQETAFSSSVTLLLLLFITYYLLALYHY